MSLTKRRGDLPTTKVGKPAAAKSISELVQQPDVRLSLDNDAFLRVAENLVYLRRYRRLTQHDVALRMKTSQAAVARIEGACENITLQTLEKALTALEGRLHLSFTPAELHFPTLPNWWDLMVHNLEATQPYSCTFIARQTGDPLRVGVGWEAASTNTAAVGAVTVKVSAVPKALPSAQVKAAEVA